MYKQKIILRYVAFILVFSLIIFGGYLVYKNMSNKQETIKYLEEESQPLATQNVQTDIESELKYYSENILVSVLNKVIPSIKISYQNNYNEKMSSFFSNSMQKIASKINLDISDPTTYFRFVLTAFGQYSTDTKTIAVFDEEELPDITRFEDAPEGAIYFSEYEEYVAENKNNNDTLISSEIETEKENIYGNPNRIKLSKKDPEILIYHTHTTESYMPVTTGNSHTMDERYNVVLVGSIMTDLLQRKYNYKVAYDKTYHDAKSYADSYINSLLTVRKQLSTNNSLKVVLDIHRDAFPTEIGQQEKKQKKSAYTVDINGKDAAKVMLVIGKDNPNYTELEKFAVYITRIMDKLYPGLLLKIERKNKARYNQFLSDYSVLIEVGCNLNTDKEAKYSAELMANVIGEVLNSLKE